MRFWKSMIGTADVSLTSAVPEAALEAINALGIELMQLQQCGTLTYRFRLPWKSFSRVQKLCAQRGETLQLISAYGFFLTGIRLLKRPAFLFLLIALAGCTFVFPTRIFFVNVTGNQTVPERRILSAAEDSGIYFGAQRKEVRSEKVKNALMEALPELQWAGVNTSGCTATISVREKTASNPAPQVHTVSNIIACRDGYILSGTVVRGSPFFHIGEAVKEGQVLISGYTDCGISIRAERAKGEIFALTNRKIHAVTPTEFSKRGTLTDTKKKISIILGKKRINLWKDSGISEVSCGRMYEEYYITLPGGFRLPAALCIETFLYFDSESCTAFTKETSLNQFAEQYIVSQMIAGSIQNRQVTIEEKEDCCILFGNYSCVEMIGREQREQIGDLNGKNS